MILNLIFRLLGTTNQINLIKNQGILLGLKKQEGRDVYVYMFCSMIAEIVYVNDEPEGIAENMRISFKTRKLDSSRLTTYMGLNKFSI